MTAYTKEYIGPLLDRFMDGATSLEEERLLAAYFRQQEVPTEWVAYREMFAYFDRGMAQEYRPRRRGRRVWLAAASVAVLAVLAFGWWMPRRTGKPVAEAKKELAVPKETKSPAMPEPANPVLAVQQPSGQPRAPWQSVKPSPRKPKADKQLATENARLKQAVEELRRKNGQAMQALERARMLVEQSRQEVLDARMRARGYQVVMNEEGEKEYEKENEIKEI